jgi:hypothetical protein
MGREADAGVEVRMTQNDYDPMTLVPTRLQSTLDQQGTDPLTLVLGEDRQRRQRQCRDDALIREYGQIAEQNMAGNHAINLGDQGNACMIAGAQRIDEASFIVSSEGEAVNLPDAFEVLKGLIANVRSHGFMLSSPLMVCHGAGASRTPAPLLLVLCSSNYFLNANYPISHPS